MVFPQNVSDRQKIIIHLLRPGDVFGDEIAGTYIDVELVLHDQAVVPQRIIELNRIWRANDKPPQPPPATTTRGRVPRSINRPAIVTTAGCAKAVERPPACAVTESAPAPASILRRSIRMFPPVFCFVIDNQHEKRNAHQTTRDGRTSIAHQ